jgi:hypothetical protein
MEIPQLIMKTNISEIPVAPEKKNLPAEIIPWSETLNKEFLFVVADFAASAQFKDLWFSPSPGHTLH